MTFISRLICVSCLIQNFVFEKYKLNTLSTKTYTICHHLLLIEQAVLIVFCFFKGIIIELFLRKSYETINKVSLRLMCKLKGKILFHKLMKLPSFVSKVIHDFFYPRKMFFFSVFIGHGSLCASNIFTW